jgi:phage-related protein
MDTLPTVSRNPSWGTATDTTAKVIESDFADGYSQRVPDGINNVSDSYSVVWTDMPLADVETLITFFKGKGGATAFYATRAQKTVAQKWTCAKWRDEPTKPGRATLTATFQERFDLA